MKDKQAEHEILSMNAFINMMMTADHISAFVHSHLKELGLTISQFGVLEALFTKGSMCQKDIAAIIRKTTGNMTTVIDNLEKNGLAVRDKDMNDRRYFTVRITDKGRELLRSSFEIYRKKVTEVMGVLDESEQNQLMDICRKLAKTKVD